MLYFAVPLALSTVVIVIKYVVQSLQGAQQFLENTNKAHEQAQSSFFYQDAATDDALTALFREKR